jgi:hypothetical protein
MIPLIIILLSLVIILSFSVYRLLKKQEIAEDMIINYNKYLQRISQTIELSDLKLKEIDYKGTFVGDDEVGFFFKGIKDLQSILNEFTIKNIDQ